MKSPFCYCPNCRSPNIDFLQQKQLLCRDCGFTYFHNVATAVSAIIRCQQQILFAIRARQPGLGMLDLPGGFSDPGETLEQALQREILEELGLDIDTPRYLFSFANSYPYRNVVYRSSDAIFEVVLGEKPAIAAADDVADSCWIDLQAIDLRAIAFDSVREAILALRRQ